MARLDIDDDVHARIKAHCARHNVSMTGWATDIFIRILSGEIAVPVPVETRRIKYQRQPPPILDPATRPPFFAGRQRRRP